MSGYGRSVPFAIQTQADAAECLPLGCPTLLKVTYQCWILGLIARGSRDILYMLWLGATIATIVANGSNSVALNLQVKVFEWNPVKWQASRASCCSWQKNCRVARQGICLLQDMSPFFSLQISFLQRPECILVR